MLSKYIHLYCCVYCIPLTYFYMMINSTNSTLFRICYGEKLIEEALLKRNIKLLYRGSYKNCKQDLNSILNYSFHLKRNR